MRALADLATIALLMRSLKAPVASSGQALQAGKEEQGRSSNKLVSSASPLLATQRTVPQDQVPVICYSTTPEVVNRPPITSMHPDATSDALYRPPITITTQNKTKVPRQPSMWMAEDTLDPVCVFLYRGTCSLTLALKQRPVNAALVMYQCPSPPSRPGTVPRELLSYVWLLFWTFVTSLALYVIFGVFRVLHNDVDAKILEYSNGETTLPLGTGCTSISY